MLTLRVLNSDASLNAFTYSSSASFMKGEDVTLLLMLWQPDKAIRYIPDSGAVITCDFMKSDGTVLTKTATQPFADDRSIIQFALSAVETATLISQNLVVKVVEGSETQFAVLQFGFQLVTLTQGC